MNTDDQKANIDTYIEDLIKQKFAKQIAIEPEVKEELKKDIQNRLNEFIMARVIAGLTDEDVVKFEGLIKTGTSQEELQQFAATHISDFTTFLTNVLLEFRSLYLGQIPPLPAQ